MGELHDIQVISHYKKINYSSESKSEQLRVEMISSSILREQYAQLDKGPVLQRSWFQNP